MMDSVRKEDRAFLFICHGLRNSIEPFFAKDPASGEPSGIDINGVYMMVPNIGQWSARRDVRQNVV